jgi:hypothetical protein
VLNSINSAHISFKVGLDVFESVLLGKNWKKCSDFFKICLQL